MIKRKIYFDNRNGNVIVHIPEQTNTFGFVDTSIDEDFDSLQSLKDRDRNTIDVLIFEYGQYAQDFAECNGYRVNPDTKELEFSYPEPNEPTAPPVYQKALSEQIAEVKAKNEELTMTVDSILTDVIPSLFG